MRRSDRRGQALVIAIFILAFLTAIAIAFYTSTTMQLRRALNVSNRVQAAQAAEAGIAMAQAFLRHDAIIHNTYTSYDFAFSTYFNGAAFAQKAWAFPAGSRVPLVPAVAPPGLGDRLYIPRAQGGDPTVDPLDFTGPFAVDQSVGALTPAEQIDTWADVDNNDDGLRDAIWLPLPRDRFFTDDGIDNDLDGLVDESQRMHEDGLDNDGDGVVDDAAERDSPEDSAKTVEPERAVFIYFGGDDGLDNDGDGAIDEADEQKLFCTTVIMDGAGNPLGNVDVRVNSNAENFPTGLTVDLGPPETVTVNITDPLTDPNSDVDVLDNDYDLVVNNGQQHIFNDADPDPPGTWQPIRTWSLVKREAYLAEVVEAFNEIDYNAYLQPLGFPIETHLTASGEPVCDVVGRVAVLVEDATAKLNLNIINGYAPNYASYNEDRMTAGSGDSDRIPPITRNLNLGVDPSEWDARVLPNMGPLTAENISQMRTGAPEGNGLSVYTIPPFPGPQPPPPAAPLEYDLGFPGYGRVDDNGNALWAALSGIDWDGSGWPYDGVIPYDYTGAGSFQFPNLEGIDEPQEYSPYRTPRNREAENDGLDNDGDGLIDEFGELGDWYYRTNRQLSLVQDIGATRSRQLRPVTIAHNFSRGDRFSYFDNFGELRDEPTLTGLRLDYNYALADQIKDMLSRDWGYLIGTRLNPLVDRLVAALVADGVPLPDAQDQADELAGFSLGLLRENVAVMPLEMAAGFAYEPIGILAGAINADPLTDYPDRFPADTGVRALQLATNLVDQRDPDHVRTTLSDTVFDLWWEGVLGGAPREIEYSASGTESIRINELMVRPVRRIEAEVTVDPAAPDYQAMFNFEPAEPPAYSPSLDPNGFSYPTVPDFLVLAENFESHPDYRGKIAAATALDFSSTTSAWSAGGDTTPLFPGNRAYVATTEAYLDNAPETAPELAFLEPPPDVVQFLFAPSAQLPAGRYYMLISTLDAAGNPTVPQAWNLEYAVKYCRRVDADPAVVGYPTFNGKVADYDDIIYDVFDEFYPEDVAAPEPPVPWQQLDPYAMGDFIQRPDEAQLDGKIFLPTRLVRNPGPAIPGYEQDDAYTVEIPPVAPDPADQVLLCVAFKMGDVDPGTIAINFFEFSQEPDHEWVELVNIAEPPDYADLGNPALMNATLDDAERARWAEKASVDLSGWHLEIGYEGNDDYATMRIPEGTFIAPGGSILVGVNKYDRFQHPDAVEPDPTGPVAGLVPLIFQNGIGLARGNDPAWLANVTVPPIPNPMLTPALESVFDRALMPGGVDFPSFWDDWLQSTLDPVTGFAGANKPWDRIVEAEVSLSGHAEPYPMVIEAGPDGTGDAATGTFTPSPAPSWIPNVFVGNYLRQLVGGEYNYWQIVSNTATTLALAPAPNAFPAPWPAGAAWAIVPEPAFSDIRQLAILVLRGGILPNYPEQDAIDNDNDNAVLVSDSLDNNGDGIVDDPGEGIDEGRLERWLANVNQDTAPGEFSIYSLEYETLLTTFSPGDPAAADYPPVLAYPPYLGSWQDHPEWKAFVERRMFPGDLVTVSLYTGEGENKKLVDQATYTEKDVVNRAIDDVLECPYTVDLDGDGLTTLAFRGGSFDESPVLDPRFATWWPDNTMGIDFYRSLPRKHPFYTGDRFGAANRWTATDGAYDDWAPSFGPWKDATTHWLDVVDGPDEYGHAFSGTPLRRNVFETLLEAPFATGDPLDPGVLGPAWDIDFGGWGLEWQTVRNRDYSSAQQLLEMPHLMMREELGTASGGGGLAFAQNVAERALVGQPELEVYNVPTGTTGPQNTDSVALASSMTSDALELTCAQADFYPLFPGPVDLASAVAGGNNLHQWDTATGVLPSVWAPIFLYSLGEPVTAPATDAGLQPYHWQPAINNSGMPDWQVQLNFLLAAPQNYPPGLAAADLALRWPLWERPVIFVSGNMPNFDQNMSRTDDILTPRPAYGDATFNAHPAEALFVWDADDGLEDGEYEVYVVAGGLDLNLLDWGQEIADLRANLTDLIEPTFGHDFLEALNVAEPNLRELAVDIEVFTDRGIDSDSDGIRDMGFGDGKVWDDANGNFFPEPGELLRAENQESFGMKYGATPNGEGVIHYGLVKVENNYLALFLRNWSKPGVLNRFARVILAPRARSHGRININTAQMSPGPSAAFNPLMGIPGVLAGYDPATFALGFLADTNNYGPGDPEVINARALAATIVAGRYEWPDGRYYRSLGDLAVYDADTLGSPEWAAAASPLITPASAGDEEAEFFELTGRFGRMLNLISTHSDVFEINVTAESGYISNEDLNNDGQLDWRYDFVTTAQKKVRVIYER